MVSYKKVNNVAYTPFKHGYTQFYDGISDQYTIIPDVYSIISTPNKPKYKN